jgi:type I restriction enzyme S subunit
MSAANFSGWRTTKVKFVSNVISGGTPQSSNPNYWEGVMPWLTPVDLGKEGSYSIDSSNRTITTEGVAAAGLVILPPGSVVISTRAPIGSVGRLVCEATTNQGCKAIVPDVRKLHSAFAFYLALTAADELQSLGLGTTFVECSTYSLKNLKISLPTLSEQRRIATYLDERTAKIDRLMDMRRRQIELLKEQRAALIQQAITRGLNPKAPMKDSGLPWLGEIPAHWKKTKLRRIAPQGRGMFVNGPFGSDLLTSELTDSGVPVVYIRDIKTQGYFRVSEACVTAEKAISLDVFRVDPGDIVVAKVGNPPGTAAIYPEGEPNGIVTQDVIRIKPDPRYVNAEFIVYLLNSPAGQASIDQISVESTRMRVDLASYKSLQIWLPQLDEQHVILDFIRCRSSQIDAIISAHTRQLTLLTEYRSALIHECVTGQRPVPESSYPKDKLK